MGHRSVWSCCKRLGTTQHDTPKPSGSSDRGSQLGGISTFGCQLDWSQILAYLTSAPATPSARTSRRAHSLKIEPTVDYRWQPWNRGRCVSPPEQIRISKRQNETDSPANPPGPHPGRYRNSDQDQSRAHQRCDDSPGKIKFPIICCWSRASTESAPDKPSRNPERESDQQRERHGPNQV